MESDKRNPSSGITRVVKWVKGAITALNVPGEPETNHVSTLPRFGPMKHPADNLPKK